MASASNASEGQSSGGRLRLARLVAAAGLQLIPLVSLGVSEVTSYALIRDDATLEVAGRHLRLYGIYIPQTDRFCESRIRPARCGSRAARALRFKVQGFVSCQLGGKYSDGSIAAYCRADEQDLGSYLIERGWAVALPSAPFAYHVSERIARHRGFGVWGFNVDSIAPTP